MGLKEMLIAAAEKQADLVKDQMIEKLGSDEMNEMIATKINEKIDIPFVSEGTNFEWSICCISSPSFMPQTALGTTSCTS